MSPFAGEGVDAPGLIGVSASSCGATRYSASHNGASVIVSPVSRPGLSTKTTSKRLRKSCNNHAAASFDIDTSAASMRGQDVESRRGGRENRFFDGRFSRQHFVKADFRLVS